INASGQIQGNSQTLLRQGGKTLVLRAQWQHSPQAGHSACTYIDSAADCWFWGATLSGKSNLNIFLDPKPFKKANREGKGLEHLFKQLYNHYRWQGEMPKPEQVALDIMNATAYVSTDPISPKMVLVGGAAIRIDPLSSQGIHIAIATAVQAAVAVNTLIHYPKNQADAIAFYRQRVRKRSDDHALFQSQAYRDAEANYKTPFWAERIPKDRLAAQDSAVQPFPSDHAINYYRRYSLHKDAKFGNTAVMGKDFIKSVPSLNHPRLSEPSFIADLKTIRQVLKQLSAIPLVMVLNHPLHKQYRNELEPLLSYWISCGVLEVV
ncbi:MAG: tryptophan 7-halogenase, partial [Gammaproteobacteria bacterium]|nr:tryptophan 7-halogenase [Gammaproteobacteria bacterium]